MQKYQQIVRQFIKDAGQPLRFKEIMVALGVVKGEKAALKNALDQLVEAGELLINEGNRYTIPGQSQLVTGRLIAHRDGYGFVTPEEGGEDLFIPARFLRGNMHGDKVVVRVEKGGRDGKREGRIVQTLERAYSKIVGRFEQGKKFGLLLPDELRITQELVIPPNACGKAKSGQVVVAEITAYPTAQRRGEGRVVQVLGWPDDPEVEVLTIVNKFGLPSVFPAEVLTEARATSRHVGEADRQGRVDLRGNLTVTIDGETARDFDDAVSVQRSGADKIRLWVSIADVSHYVKPGTPLDHESYLRGTSVYFPDRCIPMLPEELSNGICSLNPAVERLTMTAEMLFGSHGALLDARFYSSVIKSDARLTYTTVKQIVTDNDPAVVESHRHLVADLLLMKELALRLMERRRQRGSIDFDLPEPEIVLDLQGGTLAIIRSERNLAHKMIEEFMLAANEAVASHIEQQQVPSLYRVHEPPDPAKLRDFQEFIYNFGYEFKLPEENVAPGELQRLLGQAAGKPEERMINEIMLRCMKQARYAPENLGHFGLAAPCYTHFTSPIRRYPDLVVHRILKGIIGKKLWEQDKDRLAAILPEVAEHTSKRERVAMEAEREIIELKKMQYMQHKVGEEFDGIITGVTAFGLFVELVELFVEGLVHVTRLRPDFYRYLEKQHTLIGERSREIFRIGDRVRVRLENVSLEKKQIDFALTDGHLPRYAAATDRVQEEYPRIPVQGKRPAAMKRSGARPAPTNNGRKPGGRKKR